MTYSRIEVYSHACFSHVIVVTGEKYGGLIVVGRVFDIDPIVHEVVLEHDPPLHYVYSPP